MSNPTDYSSLAEAVEQLTAISGDLTRAIATLRVVAGRSPEPLHTQVGQLALELGSCQLATDALVQLGRGCPGPALYVIKGGRQELPPRSTFESGPGSDVPF